MKNPLTSIRFTLALATGLFASVVSSQAQSVLVSATIYGVAVSGGYDYALSLENTGTEDLNTLWYGWTFDGNNLSATPSNFGSSLGWSGSLDGSDPSSIIWENDSGTALSAGQTAIFTFFSADSPTAITTDPSGGSYAYTGVGVFNGADTGQFSPSLVAAPAPEPSSIALLAIGSFGLLLVGQRKIHGRRLVLAENL